MGENIKELQDGFEESQYNECKPSRLEYLAENIFDFTSYDSSVAELFAQGMIEVIECIVSRKTFEYHGQSEGKYMTYLTMVNMPFLKDKLDWGTSIRGAWINSSDFEDRCKAILEWSKS